ncbi:WAT1-related protein [Striga hermonthica]|uniref:WAT1-related protein n=1 Tax=Striga hermonthica TaxID=68872 RepID=A0A9N7MRU5_STRHE|nr:WAT1-related protein [Striga hermonthica]
MEGKGFCSLFENAKPYIAMICLQFGYAGMNIITKVSLNRGMSHYVLVVYRHAFATAVIAPFALVLERKVRPKITFTIFMQLFVLGLLGPVIDQNFYYAGLKFTSPTFSCAMSNMLPAMTFVMAVLCRMEKLEIKKVRCQAKVVGTIVTVAGAMLMTLYKGDMINLFWSKYLHHPLRSNVPSSTGQHTDKDWFKGSILLIIATFAWASFFILQAITMRKYTAQLSLTALVCFMGTLQSIAVTFVMEHKPHVWAIGFDMNLLAAAYAKRGPVFVTAFSPLMMIIVAIMGSFILAEKIYVGGVLGAVLIVIGLYSVLWGKYKEYKEKEEEILEPVKGDNHMNLGTIIEDIEANTFVQLNKMEEKEENRLYVSPVAISGPMPQPTMLALQAPKNISN